MITTLDDANRELARFHPGAVQSTDPGALQRPDIYTLTYMNQFMEFLGNPQDKLQVVHIAGTSGKTSTCYYVASLLHAAGKRVGLSVSPHIYEVNERVQIDLVPLEEQAFCASLNEFLELVHRSGIPLTYFEIMAAFAYWIFARERVDYAVIEVGLGGLLDATNVVHRPDKVAVITDIGLDHQKWLGDTVAAITDHKAGIIQLRNTAFIYRQDDTVMGGVMRRASQKQADLHVMGAPRLPQALQDLPLFQQRNFYLAWQVARHIAARDGFEISPDQRDAAARIAIPGRLQIVSYKGRRLILDGAHNAQKLHALGKSLRALYPGKDIAVVAAFMKADSPRLPPAVAELSAFVDHIIATCPTEAEAGGKRFEDPALIIAHCKTTGHLSVEARPGLGQALDALARRTEPILLVTGSLYALNAVKNKCATGDTKPLY